jgi:NADH-quinone oxidoreductase subunit C
MTNEFILSRIQEKFGSDVIASEVNFGILTLEITANKSYEIIEWLNKDEILDCSFLTLLGGVHYPDDLNREFAIVYHLHSWRKDFRLRLKVFVSAENPTVRSIVKIYNGANWMERETFDFFGIKFEGHPDLRRILNMDDMDYFPMRKEYALEDATREDKDDRFFGRSSNI